MEHTYDDRQQCEGVLMSDVEDRNKLLGVG